MWINPLNRLPQIPVDYANHIAQGGLYSTLLTVWLALWLRDLRGYETHAAMQVASLVSLGMMSVVSVGKKVFDYFKEGESLRMCVLKAVVTVLWPATVAAGVWA